MKWDKNEIESIILNTGLKFEDSNNGFYSKVYLEDNNKFYMRILVLTNTINIDMYGRHYNRIRSYDEFKRVLNHYKNELESRSIKNYCRNAKLY